MDKRPKSKPPGQHSGNRAILMVATVLVVLLVGYFLLDQFGIIATEDNALPSQSPDDTSQSMPE